MRRGGTATERLYWGGDDPFTHTLITGPTRCGKTATLIKPLIYQILLAKTRGIQCGLSVIEPKGDVAQFTVDLARELGIAVYHLDPTSSNSDKINLMKGPTDDVAEATIAVLKGMFGRQEVFFQLVQELTARNFIKLLKTNLGDKLDIMTMLVTLRDKGTLDKNIDMLEKSGKDPELLSFFRNEMQGKLGDDWRKLALGLRAQIENIVSNESLRKVITGDSGIDLDKHMAEGGVLAVNTALGKLRRSGDAFGQFMAMHLQAATFRRPGTERTRVPHYLIIDEKSRYINPDTEKFLSIAAEYRVAAIFAIQSFSQLELESGDLSARAMKTAILSSCRNKICFGGITFDDARHFANELGMDWSITRQNTYDGSVVSTIMPKTYRDTESEEHRIRSTDLQDGLPRFYFVHKLIKDGQPQKPGIVVGDFVPKNWREIARAVREENEGRKEKSKPKDQEPVKGLFSVSRLLEFLKLFRKGGDLALNTDIETNDHLKGGEVQEITPDIKKQIIAVSNRLDKPKEAFEGSEHKGPERKLVVTEKIETKIETKDVGAKEVHTKDLEKELQEKNKNFI